MDNIIKRRIKAVFIVIFITIGAFIASYVFADTLKGTFNTGYWYYAAEANGRNWTGFAPSTSFTLSKINLTNYISSGANSALYICDHDAGYASNDANNCGTLVAVSESNGSGGSCGVENNTDFIFDTPPVLTSGVTYYFRIIADGAGSYPYPYGGSGGGCWASSVWSLYSSTPSSNQITMISPSSSYSTTTPSIAVHAQAYVMSAGTYNNNIAFLIARSPNSFLQVYGGNYITATSSGYIDFYDTIPNLTYNGDYTDWMMQLYKSDGTLLATSTVSTTTVTITGLPDVGHGTQYYTGSSTTFYTDNLPTMLSDNGLATPSAFYTDVTGWVDNIINQIYGFTGSFSTFFSDTNAQQWGGTIKTALTSVFGFIHDYDDYAGGYPFIESLIIFIILEIAIIVIKGVRVLLFR